MPLPQQTRLGEIGRGLLVLLGIGKTDNQDDADWMIKKLLNLRIFPDEADKMNRSVTDIGGGILVVSQFTLYGDARKGTRPSFTDAMSPEDAGRFYNDFMSKLRAATSLPIAEGKFAAMMEVELVNDGPVTIILETPVVGQASRLSPSSSHRGTGETPVPLFQPFDPNTPATITHRHLPHWQQAGGTYFVTFRLAGSLPQEKLHEWRAQREQWLRQHPPPHDTATASEFQHRIMEQIQEWLDVGHGECWLRRPAISTLMVETFRHFDGKRYHLGAYVIMPNHVHALVTPIGEWALDKVLHSWKSFTSHEINRALKRTGPVWQDESFDHIVRDEHHLHEIEAYIQQNPIKAGLEKGEYCLGQGQAGRLSH